MRYLHSIILLLLSCSAILFCSCSDEAEPQKALDSEALFDVRSLSFEGVAADQSQCVSFKAPAAWSAEIHSIGNWLKADVLHGEAGTARILLSPRSDNFNVGQREAQLEVFIDGYKPYVITILQKSAATGDIQVEGLGEDGILTLLADETGTEFRDTLWVSSDKRWSLAADPQQSGDILSFETDGQPRQGEQTRVRVIVKASYAKFQDTRFAGQFYIRTDEGSAVPIRVSASASVMVFENEYPLGEEAESEKVSFNMHNHVQNGVFLTDCFIQSNIRWTVGSIPAWVETSTAIDGITNVLSSGHINPLRQHVAFRVKDSELSRDGKTGTVTLLDPQGRLLKTIYLTFAGVGSNYIDSRLSFPALDPLGNTFGFEAKASSIDASNPADAWKQIRREFDIITSTDYTSLSNAPFHLLLVHADNGIPSRREVHWAHLEYVGRQSSSMQGLYCHKLAICASDRGDEDDLRGLTRETEWRHAMLYLVPCHVLFEDLWDENGNLLEKYASSSVLIAQKNNADADYKFGFQEVENGGTLTVPASGGSLNLTITPGSFTQCDILMQQQNASGQWVTLDSKVCQMDIAVDEHQHPTSILFTLSSNKGEVNPFTHQVVGSDRHIRISILAFLGDTEGSRTIFTFYIDQALMGN